MAVKARAAITYFRIKGLLAQGTPVGKFPATPNLSILDSRKAAIHSKHPSMKFHYLSLIHTSLHDLIKPTTAVNTRSFTYSQSPSTVVQAR